LRKALSSGIDTQENRLAFRNVFYSFIVHPTGKRTPYAVTPHARIAALIGVDLFPAKRSNAEILAAEGCTDTENTEKSVSSQ
jgi:hypothetical protein